LRVNPQPLTIVGHGQNGHLRDGAVTALNTTSTLVHGGKIGIHVTGVTTATGHLFAGSGDLTKGITVGGQVSENDENVLLQLVGVVLGGGQGETGGNDTLDAGEIVSRSYSTGPQVNSRRVVCQVGEHGDTLHGTVLLEVLGEETGSLQVDTHGTEDDGEVVVVHILGALALVLDETCLTTDLRGNLVVRKTRCRENWDLLATGDRVHGVNGADTGGDHLLGVDSRVRVDGRTVDVEVVLGQDLGSLVDGAAGTVKDTTKHVLADSELQVMTSELHFGLFFCQTALLMSPDLLCGLTFLTSTPEVPSNTCTTARFPDITSKFVQASCIRVARTSSLQNLTASL
jgi:hypothetical protein